MVIRDVSLPEPFHLPAQCRIARLFYFTAQSFDGTVGCESLRTFTRVLASLLNFWFNPNANGVGEAPSP